jgi:vacuolar protein-sorting-associated protein 4
LTPCSPGDPDAIEKSWSDIGSDELLEPPLLLNDFLKAVQTSKPTVNQADLSQQIKFTQDFGQEG